MSASEVIIRLGQLVGVEPIGALHGHDGNAREGCPRTGRRPGQTEKPGDSGSQLLEVQVVLHSAQGRCFVQVGRHVLYMNWSRSWDS